MIWLPESSTLLCASHACSKSVICKGTIAVLILILCQKLLSRPRRYKLFPVWATIEIAIASYILRRDSWGYRIFSVLRRYNGSLFGITSSHQVLLDLPGIERFMLQSSHTLAAEPVQYTLLTRVFGGVDSPDLKRKFECSWRDLLVPVGRTFLNEVTTAALVESANIPQRSASFVTFSSDPSLKKTWELSANVRVVNSKPPNGLEYVEADLQSLTRDFGACMAVPLLYGKKFLDQCPRVLDDFWKFDNELFPLCMIGVPEWAPFKVVREGVAARTRILRDIEALYRHIDEYQRGEHELDSSLSDVSSVAFERNKIYRRDGWSLTERAAGEFALFWGQNANTHPVLFWFLIYVYSTEGVLDRVRDEIEPYINLSTTSPLQITSMDLSALYSNCQLLKACVFETYRMVNEATSVRYVAKHMRVADGDFTHELSLGTFVSAPHSIINYDPAVFEHPKEFNPDRFLDTDPDSGRMVAKYGRLRPWGAGTSMCKGRTFAEKEIMSLGAAVISLWEISPVGGSWRLPAMMPGTGVKKPAKDIRVAISERRL